MLLSSAVRVQRSSVQQSAGRPPLRYVPDYLVQSTSVPVRLHVAMLRPRAASVENVGLSVDERRRREQLFGRATGGGGGAGRRASVTAEDEALESTNEHTVGKLGGQVSQMRHVALNIQEEVHDQNAYLDGMQDNFDTAGERLQNTLRAMQQLASSSSGGHMCILALFAFFFLIAVWLLLR